MANRETQLLLQVGDDPPTPRRHKTPYFILVIGVCVIIGVALTIALPITRHKGNKNTAISEVEKASVRDSANSQPSAAIDLNNMGEESNKPGNVEADSNKLVNVDIDSSKAVIEDVDSNKTVNVDFDNNVPVNADLGSDTIEVVNGDSDTRRPVDTSKQHVGSDDADIQAGDGDTDPDLTDPDLTDPLTMAKWILNQVPLIDGDDADIQAGDGDTDPDLTDPDLTDPDLTDPDLTDPLTRAKWILNQVPLIDGHNDLAFEIRNQLQNQFQDLDLNRDLSEIWRGSRTDIPRIRKGQLGAQFWSCYVSCSTQYTDAVRVSLDQCDVIRRFVDKYPDVFQFVDTADDIMSAFQSGHVASMIGLEGGHSIDSSLGTLRQFYRLGVRYMTLTHSCNTPWADSSPVDDRPSGGDYGGLTKWGELVVMEMNRLGMLVDISHVAKATMDDALRISVAPIIFSHSSSWTRCHHHRNVQDDILLRLRANGGIIMVGFVDEYTNCFPNHHPGPATLQDVADNIDYIRSLIGPDHIGIGADYDGVPTVVTGLEDVSTYPALFSELITRGWTDDDLKKLAGLNLIRVFKQAEQVRDDMRDIEPYDTNIDQVDLPSSAEQCRPNF